MTERRDLVPFTRGLIPLGLDEQPLLTARQQQELSDALRMYAREHQIPLSPDTTRQIMGILVDSLYRASARPLNPKERIRPLIKQGLDLRENLRFQAEESLRFTSRYPSSDQERVGPFALPLPLIQTAQLESRNFFLTPQIKATQQLVALTNLRRPLVDKFAQIALTSLPQDLVGVSLDKFPEIGERAKLIHNMIASFVFRGHLSPLIPSSDLKEFVQKSKDLFNDEALEAFIEATGTNNDDKPYLASLFRQTASAFGIYRDIPDENDPNAIDSFYRQFAKDLLLLHPALEVRQFITNPARLRVDSLHIWQGGQKFGQSIVPNVEILALATRQSEAKGDQLTAQRLHDGIKVWHWFENERLAHEQKVKRAEQELQARQILSYNLDDPYFPLPKEAYFGIYVYQEKARTEMRLSRKRVEEIKKTIIEHQTLQQRAQEYQTQLNEQYGLIWPYYVPLPRDVFIQRLRSMESSLNGQLGVTTNQLNRIEDLLHLDFIWNKNHDLEFGFLGGEQAEERVKAELESTQALRETPSLFDEAAGMELFGHLFRYFQYSPKTVFLPKELRTYHEFWKNIFDSLKRKPELRNDSQFLQNLIPQILAQRIALLKFAQSVLQKRNQLPDEINEARKELQKFQEDPEKPLPEDALWHSSEAKNYILEISLITLPQVTEQEVEDLIKSAQETRSILATVPVSYLPNRVHTRRDFASSLEYNIVQLEAKIADKERLNNLSGLTRLKEQIDKLRRLRALLNNPIILLPEGEELPIKQFIRIWQKRADLVSAVYFQEEAEEQSLSAEEAYQELSRETFKMRLSNELAARRGNLAKLLSRSVEQQFVERMHSLNLVLEETTPA